MIAYAYSTQLCARMKLYILAAVLALGMVGYAIVEIRHLAKVSDLKIKLDAYEAFHCNKLEILSSTLISCTRYFRCEFSYLLSITQWYYAVAWTQLLAQAAYVYGT